MFYLGDDYEGVYFTNREAECLMHLLEGKTIVATAKELGLSHRTVEFYVKNMKMKVGAVSKIQLIEKIGKTDFVKNYHYNILMKKSAPKSAKGASRE